ncbi:hypothetical protein F5Y05DRAFT_298787 [Hypoxylon sp. FL0543]|nr:hypothetical protein F5Y05DRAFT_298787 [Hypoxylon sp. FL0543]
MGNSAEAQVDLATDSGAAPPPYTAVDTDAEGASYPPAPSYEAVPGASSSSSSSAIAGVNNSFPQSLNAYLPKGLSKTFHLGEHADQPVFAVTMHSGLTSKPLLELHSGPKESDPIIATANNEKKWSCGRTTVVQILPGAISSLGAADSASDSRPESQQVAEKIIMKQTNILKNVTYPFSIEVGLGKDVRVENFEWRGSRGAEIQGLDKYTRGYKLVRLGREGAGKGGERSSRAANTTSDGKEVVAVFAQNTGWSMYKVFKFQFLESGATGVLGDRFALTALMTALKIWYIEYIAQTASASA